jgi:hypothetical protein
MTTDNKTLAVDVLAVMLDDAQKAKRHRMTVDAEYADDAEEESEAARAAVAELIGIGSRLNWYSHEGVFSAFHAALARVKGESV